MPICLRRREFLAGLGGAAVLWPLAAGAQQRAMPVVGWLSTRNSETNAYVLPAFRRGLDRQGYVEGRNVTIEYRWSDTQRSTAGSRGRPCPAAGSRCRRGRRRSICVAGSSGHHHNASDCQCGGLAEHRFEAPRRQRYRCSRLWRPGGRGGRGPGGKAHRASAPAAAPRDHDCCFGDSHRR